MKITPQQIKEKYRSLPPDIIEVYSHEDTVTKITEIGQKHYLHVDQIGELADEIGLVMLGINKADNFVNHVADRLSVDQAAANAIAVDVNEQIFLKIRESLQKLHTDQASRDELLASSLNKEGEEEKLKAESSKLKAEPSGVFEEKMGKLFRIPREEIELDPYLEKPE